MGWTVTPIVQQIRFSFRPPKRLSKPVSPQEWGRVVELDFTKLQSSRDEK